MSADLFKKTVKFLDPHLALIIVENFEENKVIDIKTVTREKLAILTKTSMFDYTIPELEKAAKLDASVAGDIKRLVDAAASKKETAAKIIAKFKIDSEKFLNSVVNDETVYKKLEETNFDEATFASLSEDNKLSFSKDEVDFVCRYARALYDAGLYKESNKILNCVSGFAEDDETILSISWGLLFSNILIEEYAKAFEGAKTLRDLLEKERNKEKVTNMQQLAGKVNFLHTLLVLFYTYKFNEETLDFLVETFLRESYLNAVQVGAPHLLRYLVSSLFLMKNSPKFDINKLLGLVPYLKPEVSNYSDCLTEFTIALLEDYDFKKTQTILKRFKAEIAADYFLQKHIDTLVNNARTIFFEVYCKIYRKIDLKMVASFLETDVESAEIWIVNLIRNANFEAKVDPTSGVINLNPSKVTVYEQVLNKTRDLLPRTNILINNITRILK